MIDGHKRAALDSNSPNTFTFGICLHTACEHHVISWNWDFPLITESPSSSSPDDHHLSSTLHINCLRSCNSYLYSEQVYISRSYILSKSVSVEFILRASVPNINVKRNYRLNTKKVCYELKYIVDNNWWWNTVCFMSKVITITTDHDEPLQANTNTTTKWVETVR